MEVLQDEFDNVRLYYKINVLCLSRIRSYTIHKLMSYSKNIRYVLKEGKTSCKPGMMNCSHINNIASKKPLTE